MTWLGHNEICWGLNKIADILQTIFSNAFLERLFVPQGPIYKKPSSLAVMAWQQTDDDPLPELMMTQFANTIWVRSRMCGCLVTWFCYHLIAKPGNKTAAVPWPDPYHQEHNSDLEYIRVSSHEPSQNSLTFPWHFPDHFEVFPDHETYYPHFITALTLILQAIWQITHQK